MNSDHYLTKNEHYYAGARKDWLDYLPAAKESNILEIGPGNGNTGALIKANNKCSFYAAIELVESAANEAKKKLDQVIYGNAEKIDFPWPKKHFNVLLMSEVIEHLENPDIFLKAIYPYLADNALVMASSPNVSHHSIIKMLFKGEWKLRNEGIMDKTHLRWFTPISYKRLFEESGFKVIDIKPLNKFGPKSKLLNFMTFGILNHIFWEQIDIKCHKL